MEEKSRFHLSLPPIGAKVFTSSLQIHVSESRKSYRIIEFHNDKTCPEITVGRPGQVTGKITDKKSRARGLASGPFSSYLQAGPWNPTE